MNDRTSGFGASSATSNSISRFERWTARASNSSALSSRRCGDSLATALR
jgi:hypothetical protein